MKPLRPFRRTLRAPLAGALLGASALLWGRQAAAEESAAEQLFREGRALLVEQRFAEACPKLEESQRLEPSLGTKLNLAFCHERLGQVATAWVGFQEALITARTAGDAAREAFAKARIDALSPRVPWLRVRASAGGAGADQVTILLDGAALDPVAWDKELPVDPGEHVVAAAHQGEVFWETTVALKESERVDVAVPAPAQAEAAPAPVPAEAAPGAASRPARLPRARLLPEAQRDGVRDETSVRAASPGIADRLVFEAGGFIGYLWMEAGEMAACSTSGYGDCYHALSEGSFLAGATGFIGYTATERLDLGVRAHLSLHSSEGLLIALGPSVSYPLGDRFRVGATLFFGTATQSGVVYTDGYSWDENGYQYGGDMVEASVPLGFALGLGAEIGMKLTDSPSGSLFLQATPLFLVGADGLAASLPLGVAYRWN
ncbi:hypothetical protein BE21_45910 [Sorangium cellulosum]|uniref:PEGA domain-containing protein n=1 Tax=Sorangium cellulosum TaxID=56 RepID=A0A150TIT4_SORCE|nr:hypothetical protein BE21_45910 [Sorangium cellulosum]